MSPTPLLDWEPPSQHHSPTSREAGERIKESAATLREKVYRCIERWTPLEGCTDEDIQVWLEMSGNTQRPRRRELQQAGRIKDSGRTRSTSSGRQAVVWVVT